MQQLIGRFSIDNNLKKNDYNKNKNIWDRGNGYLLTIDHSIKYILDEAFTISHSKTFFTN